MTEARLYHPTKRSGPMFSFGKKEKQQSRSVVPGPGAYESPPKLPSEQLGSRFNRSNRELPIQSRDVPGPGSYDDKQDLKGPRFTMRARMGQVGRQVLPGPGNYEGKSAIGEGSKFSFGKRIEQKKDIHDMAPGDYDIVRPNLKGTRFGTEKTREQIPTTLAPGPGAYNIKEIKDAPVYRMRGRINRTHRESYPGPGAYEHQDTNSGRTTLFKSNRFASENKYESPGPGAYDANDPREREWNNKSTDSGIGKTRKNLQIHQNVSKSGFGIGKRIPDLNDDHVPGPGAYMIPGRKEAPSFSMRARKELSKSVEVPGPGSYNTKPITEGPRFSLGKRFATNSKEGIPGPGEYNPTSTDSPRKTGMGGKSKRLPYATHDSPGPGAYNVPKITDNSPQFGFGKDVRMKKAKPLDNHELYNIPSAMPTAPRYFVK